MNPLLILQLLALAAIIDTWVSVCRFFQRLIKPFKMCKKVTIKIDEFTLGVLFEAIEYLSYEELNPGYGHMAIIWVLREWKIKTQARISMSISSSEIIRLRPTMPQVYALRWLIAKTEIYNPHEFATMVTLSNVLDQMITDDMRRTKYKNLSA